MNEVVKKVFDVGYEGSLNNAMMHLPQGVSNLFYDILLFIGRSYEWWQELLIQEENKMITTSLLALGAIICIYLLKNDVF